MTSLAACFILLVPLAIQFKESTNTFATLFCFMLGVAFGINAIVAIMEITK